VTDPEARIRWAGPAVTLALVAAVFAARAARPAAGDCGGAANAFGMAARRWHERYEHYADVAQHGPRDAVPAAAASLTRATDDIAATGGALLRCLASLE